MTSSKLRVHALKQKTFLLSRILLESINELDFNGYDGEEIFPLLPSLIRKAFSPNSFSNVISDPVQSKIRHVLSKLDESNAVASYFTCDFAQLESDLIRERNELTIKACSSGSADVRQSRSGSFARFESCTKSEDKFLILLNEISMNQSIIESKSPGYNFCQKFEPLDNLLTFEDCCYLLTIAALEMPNFMSLETMCESLLRYKFGPAAIQRLIVNFPEEFDQIAIHLASNGDALEAENFVTKQRLETLDGLCSLNSNMAASLASFCLRSGKLMACLFRCGRKFFDFDDSASLLCGALFGSNIAEKTSLIQFVQYAQKQQTGALASSAWHRYKSHILTTITQYSSDQATSVTTDKIRNVINILRLICGLRSIANAKFTEDELRLIFNLVTILPEKPSTLASTLINTQLCYLLAFPPSGSQNVQYESIVMWLKKLTQMQKEYESVADNYVKTLLLIAITFHTNQLSTLSQMVSNAFRIKIQTKSNHFNRLKSIFTIDLYPEQIIAETVTQISVTKNLNATSPAFLPIHCVQQLLTNRTFAKHKVPIKHWIISQLRECTVPIHSAIPSLLEAYVNSCLLPAAAVKMSSGQASSIDLAIEERELMIYFEERVQHKNRFVFRILLFYYALLFEEIRTANLKSLVQSNQCVESISNIFQRIPIMHYFTYVEDHSNDFGALYPNLIRLTTNQFSYLFSLTLTRHLPNVPRREFKLNWAFEHLVEGLKNWTINPVRTIKLLEKLIDSPAEHLNDHFESLCDQLCECSVNMLDDSVPLKIVNLYAELFGRLERINPLTLYTTFLRSLLPKSWFTLKKLNHAGLCDDPLIVLRCDERIYRCAPVLNCILRILRCYCNASQQKWLRDLARASCSAANEAQKLTENQLILPNYGNSVQAMESEREELARALTGAQESAAVQILLEACLPNKAEMNQPSGLSSLREIQCLICSHLHQMFIDNPLLMKLVHFQGYPLQLIPVTVMGIPSMHICLDFIPEMLSQPDHSKRVFAIILLSYLAQQYTIPKAYSCAKLAVNVMHTLFTTLPGSEIVPLIDATLDAFWRISRLFPPLSVKITLLLAQVSTLLQSRLCIKGFVKPEIQLGETIGRKRQKLDSMPSSRLEFELFSRIQNEIATRAVDTVISTKI